MDHPKKADRPYFVGILGLVACLFIPILQANGVDVNWPISLVLYLVLIGVAEWSLLAYAVPDSNHRVKGVAVALVFLMMGGLGGYATRKAYRKEKADTPTQAAKTTPDGNKGVAENSTHLPDLSSTPLRVRARSVVPPSAQAPLPMKPTISVSAAPTPKTSAKPSIIPVNTPFESQQCGDYQNYPSGLVGSAALKITSAQRYKFQAEMQAYAGTKFTVLLLNPTAETLADAEQLEGLLGSAGLVCVLQVTTYAMQNYLPGIHIENSDNLDAAAQLRKSLDAVYTISDDSGFNVANFIAPDYMSEAGNSNEVIDIVIAP